ncbi:DUF2787 domain-containing protein [Alteromonas sp. NFXS44]|uniref:DUF2787 family protein n=1 Tax=Alteromonas sp. NFXS44 TaxID=2818435 RepID=UPI0032DE2FB0
MNIQNKGLALPVSQRFAENIEKLLAGGAEASEAITINFRDPAYSAEEGGFHPVEIRLQRIRDTWTICYITDFAYVGLGYFAELAKELDFDFQAGLFQNLHGVFPIETAWDIYQIWEENFLHYWQVLSPYSVTVLHQ